MYESTAEAGKKNISHLLYVEYQVWLLSEIIPKIVENQIDFINST